MHQKSKTHLVDFIIFHFISSFRSVICSTLNLKIRFFYNQDEVCQNNETVKFFKIG